MEKRSTMRSGDWNIKENALLSSSFMGTLVHWSGGMTPSNSSSPSRDILLLSTNVVLASPPTKILVIGW